MATPKFWVWRNKAKQFFQSYKDVFITPNHAEVHFFGINFGVNFFAQICASKGGVGYAKK
jgi:hypothetical protein